MHECINDEIEYQDSKYKIMFVFSSTCTCKSPNIPLFNESR